MVEGVRTLRGLRRLRGHVGVSGGRGPARVPGGMETQTTGQTTRSFPHELNEPETEVVLFAGSPWSVRIMAYASTELISLYPGISVNVLYSAKAYSVCVLDLDGTVSKKGPGSKSTSSWDSMRSETVEKVKARLDQSQALYCPEDMEKVAVALDEARRQAFLRVVRAQARSYLEVITSEDAALVWHEEEMNIILSA